MAKKQATKKPETNNADGLDIPEFLRRQGDGKFKNPPPKPPKKSAAKAPTPKPPPPPTPLERIEDPAFRAYAEGEIKSGRLQEKWLEDGSTLQLLRVEFDHKTQRKAEGLARLAVIKEERKKNAPPKPPKPAYPEDTMLVVSFVQANPRKEGSTSAARYEKFKTFMAANPKATVLEIVTKSGYYRADFMWDVKQGRIKIAEAAKAQLAKNIEAIEKEADAKVAKKKAAPKKKK